MYVSEQIDLMDSRLEDYDKRDYPAGVRRKALENSQIKIVNFLHNNYLTELQKTQTSVAVSSGKVSISGLTYRTVRGAKGIVGVRVSGGGKWFTEIDIRDAKQEESTLYKGTVLNPKYYVWMNEIVILPSTGISLVDVYHLKVPGPLIGELTYGASLSGTATKFYGDSGQDLSSTNDEYNGAVLWESATGGYHIVTDYVGSTREFTVTPGKSAGSFSTGTFKFLSDDLGVLGLEAVESELNPALHTLMVDLAVAECFEGGKDIERWKIAQEKADAVMAVLNARYEDAQGMGTKKK